MTLPCYRMLAENAKTIHNTSILRMKNGTKILYTPSKFACNIICEHNAHALHKIVRPLLEFK